LHVGSNLPPKDNLRKEEKSSAPKVSFIRRFHCSPVRRPLIINTYKHVTFCPPSRRVVPVLLAFLSKSWGTMLSISGGLYQEGCTKRVVRKVAPGGLYQEGCKERCTRRVVPGRLYQHCWQIRQKMSVTCPCLVPINHRWNSASRKESYHNSCEANR